MFLFFGNFFEISELARARRHSSVWLGQLARLLPLSSRNAAPRDSIFISLHVQTSRGHPTCAC